MKNIVGVRFINTNGSLSDIVYYYSSHINLIEGYKYNIENENGYRYSSPAVVILCRPYDTKYSNFISKVKHDIVKADFIDVSSRERSELNNFSTNKNVFTDRITGVWFNKDKRTTVVKWTDGTITKVVCNIKDNFSMEAGLALCYTKRWCFNNDPILFHSVNRRKHQRAVNKVFREVNKVIYDDELWLGRFAVVQDYSYMYTEKESNGSDYKEWGVLLVAYHFLDKKTGRKSAKVMDSSNTITNSNRIMYLMNNFIVEDCHPDVWGAKVKPSIENAEDFRKVGIQ